MPDRWDVAIAGGGPAGCAAALSIRTHDPKLSVALIEPTNYESPRAGEVLPGIARGLLRSLGIEEAFEREQWSPVYGVASAWGVPILRENHSIYSPPGHGWHLDRAKFDGFLAKQTEMRGVTLLSGVRVHGAERIQGGWRLTISAGAPAGGTLDARFVVDATGRAASITRGFGMRRVSLDALMSFARFFAVEADSDPRTLIEAVADGWWYTAALPGNRRVAAFMTDPDIARQHRLDRESSWREALDGTRFIRSVVPSTPACEERVNPAGSNRLRDPAGDGWIAVGDAACAHDPLAGQGITQSLRSGIVAAYAISDFLRDGSAQALERYRRIMQHGWSAYVAARRRYYTEEQRWTERSFWQRRHSQGEPAFTTAVRTGG